MKDSFAKKIFELEDRTKNWIINHRIKWCFILMSMGMLLGLSGIYFIDVKLSQGFIMGTCYAFLLLLTEIGAGGQGLE